MHNQEHAEAGEPVSEDACGIGHDNHARNESRLGPMESEWRAGSGYHRLVIGICGILFSIFGVITVIVAWPDPGNSGRRAVAAFFACIATLSLVGLVFFVRRLSWRLLLCENGFVLQRGGAALTVLWDEIKYLREASWDVGGLDMRIETEAGRKVVLDAVFRNSASLGRAIRGPVNSHLLAKAETQLRSNTAVGFGQLRILESGLDNGKEALSWGEVDSIALKHTGKCYKIIIRKVGKRWSWYEHIVPYFPNLEVFFILVRRFVPTKVEQDQDTRISR